MKDFYVNIHNECLKYKKGIVFTNHFLTQLFYILYPLLIIYIVLFKREDVLKFILVPGISFVVLSLVRRLIKRKRPYEVYDFKPMIKKETSQNSMPSRHVFSAVLIAMCYLYYSMELGIILLILAFVSATIRVIGGVHFISDVLVGYVCGVLCCLLLFVL